MEFHKVSLGLLLSIFSLLVLITSSCVRINVQSTDPEPKSTPPVIEACEMPTFNEQEEVVHKIRVSRHVNANITRDEAKEILTHATKVAQEGYGNQGKQGDTPCKIRFQLVEAAPNNPIDRIGTPRNPLPQGGPLDCIRNGEICSKFDFNVMASQAPTGIKVVKDIRWCNFPRAGVDGCTEKDLSMIVRRMCQQHGRCPNLEGISWLHEFGHLQGLYHRSNYVEPAVMKDTFTTFDVWLSPCECLKYRQRQAS